MKRFVGYVLILIDILAALGALTSKDLARKYNTGQGSSADGNIDSPVDLPKSKWKQALKRTKQALKDKDLAASAAGLAYYTTLSFFPVVLGIASLYAVFANPSELLSAIQNLKGLVPNSIYVLLERQITPLAKGSKTGLGIAAVVSLLALLWTTSGGMQNLVKATNKAYEVKETRKFIKLRLVSLALSIVLLVLGAIVVALLLAQGTALQQLGAPKLLADIFPIIRWPILIILISAILSAIYRYAPNRTEPRWQWVSWGATAATVLWLLATTAFFLYVQNFGNYAKTYGTFTGIVVLMIWFNISSLIILLGAQVNKKLEEVTPAKTQEDS